MAEFEMPFIRRVGWEVYEIAATGKRQFWSKLKVIEARLDGMVR